MLQWAIQFVNYYEGQLKHYKLFNPSFENIEKEQNSNLPQQHVTKTDQFSPLTSVSGHSCSVKEKAKLKKQKKILKHKLKLLKNKQNQLKTQFSFSNQVKASTSSKKSFREEIVPETDCLLQQEDDESAKEKESAKEEVNDSAHKNIDQQSEKSSQIKLDEPKQFFEYYSWQKDTIIYHKQFTYLYNHLNQIITKFHQQPVTNFSSEPPIIVVVGNSQCGKKHLISQVLHKVQNDWNQNRGSQGFRQLIVQKMFVNPQIVGYLYEDDEEEGSERSAINETEENNEEQDVEKYLRIQSVIVSGMLETDLLNKIKQSRNNISPLIIYQCISYSEFASLSHQLINPFLVIQLPSLSSQTQSNPFPSIIPHHTTHNQLIQNLDQFFVQQVNQVEQYLNLILREKENTLKCKIDYTQSVRNFVIKFIVKRYQQGQSQTPHPIIAIKYLANYLKNHYKKQLLSISQIKIPSNEDNIYHFSLTSTLITYFFNYILSPSSSSSTTPISQLSLTSLILGHQLVLMSCYLYLTNEHYLHELYINALKLYPFFVLVTKSISIQPYEQKCYWSFLEKLKERRLIRFLLDRGNKSSKQKVLNGRKQRSYCRKGKKIKHLQEYKNKDFLLLISLDKIKDDLSELQIYHKFFNQQS